MWTTETRCRYDGDRPRYPGGLTDQEWSLLAPLMPPDKHGGRGPIVHPHEIVNGIMHILMTGCQWCAISKDLPPRSTVWDCPATDVQDHDGGAHLLAMLLGLCPSLR